MSVTLTAQLSSLLSHKLFFYATCWKINRTDGVTLRFTDHNENLTVDGDLHITAGGFVASARQKQIGMGVQNLEARGFISSDAIVNDDLRAGRYREARITEKLVDWRVPWMGTLLSRRFWISEVTWTGIHWEAQLEGITRWLRSETGDVVQRLCEWDLGDARCRVDLLSITVSGRTVTAVSSSAPRTLFDSTLAGANNFWTGGLLTWTSGLNDGLKFEISAYDAGGGQTRLHLETPFEIQIGDTFSAYPGCNKKKSTCLDKFNNLDNFGGYNLIPGTDKMIKTPSI